MINHKEAEDYILNFNDVWLDYPFGEHIAVYKYGSKDNTQDAKMFALINENKAPLQISLKCDPILAVQLRQQYEEVQPGYHLNKKHWNTIVCTGQLKDNEIKDLIRHSYLLVSKAKI